MNARNLLLSALCLYATAAPAADVSLKQLVTQRLDREYASLEALYRHFHANPELSLMEEKTAARLAAELRAAGCDVTEKFGGYGVVAVLKNGKGPTVLIRADMDALPVIEETGLPYASKAKTRNSSGQEVAVMHACGHDIHMTSLVGVARVLSTLRNRWAGTLILVGQPAEEYGAGAQKMLAAGLYQKFPKPDYLLALHDSATMAAGTVAVLEGPIYANVDFLDITVRGVGGHGAYPHMTRDPVVLASRIVVALQTIVSRETRPIDPAVVTVGSIHGGTKHNVIPDTVKLQLTLRSYSDQVRNDTLAAVKRICRGEAIAAGLPEELMPIIELDPDFTPVTYNTPELARRLRAVFMDWLGEARLGDDHPVMGGEDFSEFGRTEDKIPLCYFRVGAVDPEKFAQSKKGGPGLVSLHSSKFAPLPEPTIRTAVVAMTAAALDLFGSSGSRVR